MPIPNHNAVVINSNLATPIPKRAGAPNPGHDVFSRLHYYGRERYFPEPGEELQAQSHVVVPDYKLENPTYSVYAFAVPDPIKLRVIHGARNIESLPHTRRAIAERLAHYGHGITLVVHEPELVRIEETLNANGWGVKWQVSGEATSPHLDGQLHVSAFDVPGHRVAPGTPHAGKALIEQIS